MEDQPTTKADVLPPKADVEGFEQSFYDRMDVMEHRILDRLTEALSRMETRLVGAFDLFAETNNRRLTQAEWIRLPPLV